MTLTWRCVAQWSRGCQVLYNLIGISRSFSHSSLDTRWITIQGNSSLKPWKVLHWGKWCNCHWDQKVYGEVRLKGIKKHWDKWFNSWEQKVLRREGVKNIDKYTMLLSAIWGKHLVILYRFHQVEKTRLSLYKVFEDTYAEKRNGYIHRMINGLHSAWIGFRICFYG